MTSWLRHPPELSDRDLAIVVRLVYEKSGITMHAGKRALVAARLQKRLRHTGLGSFREYVTRLQSDTSGEELTAMLDAMTTNHTAFFREPQHFEFLATVVLPSLQCRAGHVPILGWSSACATGEEPYTLAMTAIERLGEEADRRVRLFATDLSTGALARAVAGTYKAERVAELPRHLVLKYFDKRPHGVVHVTERVRRLVEFRQVNLLRMPPPGPLLDFIFCRNVMIYFDRAVQQRVIDGLQKRLAPGGYLFTSHSESLNSLDHELTWVAPAVYRRDPR